MSFAGMQPEDGWVLGSSYMRLCGRPGLGLGPAKAPMRFLGAGVGRTLQAQAPTIRIWPTNLGRVWPCQLPTLKEETPG